MQRTDVQRAILHTLTGRPHWVAWSAFSASDWDRLLATAQAEGVAPLLYHALNAAGWSGSTPGRVRHALQELYYNTAARNLLIYHELARILAQLTIHHSQRAIRPIVLKGAALAATIYPSIALRPLGDVDLLVPRQHLEAVVQTLESQGYQPVSPEMSPGLNSAIGYHVSLRGGSQPSVTVEVHWGLVAGDADWRSPPIDWFWTQTEEWKGIREQGKKGKREQGSSTFELFPLSTYSLSPLFALQLTPTAHLLYLAAHLMLQHGGARARLLWFYDLHLLLTRYADRLNWDELLGRAEAFRWTAALYAALRGTQERFDTPLPHGFLDALAQTDDHQASDLVQRKADFFQTRATGVWEALMCLGWRARFRLAWGVMCASPAYMRWRYKPRPAWLWPLCYPYRWYDMLRDGLSTLRRLARTNGE